MRRLSLLPLFPLLCLGSVFDAPELHVASSPAAAATTHLAAGARVLDFDVSPASPRVALLVAGAAGNREVRLWEIGQPQMAGIWQVPADFAARSIVWHPQLESLFLSGAHGPRYVILRIERRSGVGAARQIYSSRLEIRRLVAGPRPFLPQENRKVLKPVAAYRLFFGLRTSSGSYSIHSVTEDGQREYQVVGPRGGITKFPEAGANPSELVAASALPLGVHPAGHILLWEDAGNCFHAAGYDRDHWESNTRLFDRDFCGGTVSPTPNGMGLIHWRAGMDGVELLLNRSASPEKQAAGFQLTSAPSSVPDGRGIVGVTRGEGGVDLNYIPLRVPLADVANAWMYTETAQDTQLLDSHGGLFRDLNRWQGFGFAGVDDPAIVERCRATLGAPGP